MKKLLPILLSVLPLFGCSPSARNGAGRDESTAEAAPASSESRLQFLSASGRSVINEQGETVQLRGCNAGSWLLIEPWILGLDGQDDVNSEKDIWDLVGRRFGEERKQELIRLHRSTFFTEADVVRIADAGMNCLRIPIWWRAVSDPAYGGDMKYLEDAVRWCGTHGVYVIIDLHGAPGGQGSQPVIVGERSDGDLWKSDAYKEQTLNWWKDVAVRFKDEPAVAGYDLINEAFSAPFDDLLELYDQLYRAVRAIDPRHMLIMEDGLHGFHRLPRPSDYGWSNVMYSFHYYPQTGAEALSADGSILPRFNRAVLHFDVPVLVGEFNTMMYERGGAQSFQRFTEVFDYYGWPWTFWTYKKIEDNADIIWGLYGHYTQRPGADLNAGSWESIRDAFARMESGQGSVQPLMLCALQNPRGLAPARPADDEMLLTLRDAAVLAGEGGSLRMEWGLTPPNVGYWGRGDSVGWYVEIPAEGDYEIGLNMANNTNGCAARVEVDGVLVRDVPVERTRGWQDYQDRSLGVFHLDEGRHWLEIGQGNEGNEFINLRHAWVRAGSGPAVRPDESRVVLGPFNHPQWRERGPIRVEWMNDPANFGFWLPGESVTWSVSLERGGTYEVSAAYASPTASHLVLELDGGAARLSAELKGTGDWHAFERAAMGLLAMGAGRHTLKLTWEGGDGGGAGNLRSVTLNRTGEVLSH